MLIQSGTLISRKSRYLCLHHAPTIPELDAHGIASVKDKQHLHQVHHHLKTYGALKVNLGSSDPDSDYLRQLVLGLHQNHGHGLPSSHSLKRGWFWDVRPQPETFEHRAISETMNRFPWHTDSCYETAPANFFALHVLQHDRFGGGTLSLLSIDQLLKSIPHSVKLALSKPEFEISVPREFSKNENNTIIGSLLNIGKRGQPGRMRFRADILTPLTSRAASAYQELTFAIAQHQATETQQLTSQALPRGSIILINNGRWLHSRNHVHDPARHLRRVRWDTKSFEEYAPVSLDSAETTAESN